MPFQPTRKLNGLCALLGTQYGLEFLKQRLKEEIFEDWHGQDTSGLTGLNYTIYK